ncbi:phytoene synthase [Rhodobacteraceae bacterium MBR-64]|jgi:phytoene/squalene synthetase
MSIASCAEIVRRGDPDRFLAVMAAPVAARERLFPIHAFNLEIARAPWVTQEPLIAEMRLQWWRDALVAIGGGGALPGHEVVEPLAQVIRATDLPLPLLQAMIDARRRDILAERFADAGALWAHLDATAGNLTWLAARALGAPGAAQDVVRDMAAADGLARWFVAVPDLVARGHDPLPDPGHAAIADLARAGQARLARARAARGRVPAGAGPALMAGWRAGGILARAANDPGLVLSGGLQGSEFARRAGLLWRALTGRW